MARMPIARSVLVFGALALIGCGGGDRPRGGDGGGLDGGGGTACGDTRCTAGQVCCIDCDGHGTCGPPGTACAGPACAVDAGLDASIACADRSCSGGEVCCIGCDGRGTCGPPGTACAGTGCPPDAGPPASDAGAPHACGSSTCGTNELCIHRQSCPIGEPPAPECIPVPSGCAAGAPSCDCFDTDPCGGCAMCASVEEGDIQCSCVCICAAPDTPIATPAGERRIDTLQPGDLVYSMSHGELVAVPLRRVGRSPAPSDHAIVRVQLDSGRVLEMSPGHPTADGRHFGDLAPGETLAGVGIDAVELVPYGRPYTYDILPDSETGTYVAAGALVGSTLAPARE